MDYVLLERGVNYSISEEEENLFKRLAKDFTNDKVFWPPYFEDDNNYDIANSLASVGFITIDDDGVGITEIGRSYIETLR